MSQLMARTRIKFCGLTRPEDIAKAVALGVDALGFVMWPKSSRSITPEALRVLAAQVPAFVTRVGLFVNQPAELIEQSRRRFANSLGGPGLKRCACAMTSTYTRRQKSTRRRKRCC